uniref:Uncharacterized protein n=1 Tax=Plectus sambesii TaxID=2011161 RepID=A0A914UXK2_9BILA
MDTRRTAITIVCLVLLLSSPSFAAGKLCRQRVFGMLNSMCSDSGETPCYEKTDEKLEGLYKTCCEGACSFSYVKTFCCSE